MRLFFSRKNSEKIPEERIEDLFSKWREEIEQRIVNLPSFEAVEELGKVVYEIKDPFQFACISKNSPTIEYVPLEPPLNDKLNKCLLIVNKALENLINTDLILNVLKEKEKFVEESLDFISDLYDLKLSELERELLLYYLRRDYLGYGKIDVLMNDRFIEDISCNGPNSNIYVYHRFFESIPTKISFGEVELNSFILRLAQISGRHISILQPIRDAALPDGSRINMTLGREVTKKGSTFTIRKFRSDPISPAELISLGTSNAEIFAFFWLLVEYKKSLLISGGTATGKTTLLNAVCSFIKPESKIVSIEDTPELNLQHPNWIQAVTRVGFGESSSSSGISGVSGISMRRSPGDIDLYTLLVAALRQRPEYIIVGEVRGEEAYTLFQAISVGHSALGTVHASSMPELIARLESPPMNVPRMLISNLDLVVFPSLVKDKNGNKKRRVKNVVEVLGVDPETKEVITNTIFKWNPEKEEFEFTGRSFLLEEISNDTGISLSALNKEWNRRREFLESLVEKKVMRYREFVEVVRSYRG